MTRSLAGALAVAALAVVVAGRAVFAGPPPPMERREVKTVIAALEKDKSRRADLASVRFYAEVFDGTHVSAPIGSPLTTLGPWGDNDALLTSESAMGTCAALPTGDKLQKASALSREFGDALPPLLRAYTLAAEGKKADAVTLFVASFERATAPDACPPEHPMYSYRRAGHLSQLLSCIKTLEPARDVKKLEKAVEHAKSCAATNQAVG